MNVWANILSCDRTKTRFGQNVQHRVLNNQITALFRLLIPRCGVYNKRMEPQTKSGAKDFFINLGAIVALYTTVVSLLNLLFTIINTAYPQITNGYSYFGSTSISWPVATLIIFFPIFIFLMWLLEREYRINPEKQSAGIHKWLTYITLFLAGITIAVDLITVLYFFIDGQELTTGFLLKVLALLVVASGIFSYYLSDVLGKLTAKSRNIYCIITLLIILSSIVWGFSVLGSPRTQRLYKYDEQKVSDLTNIKYEIDSYYSLRGILPENLAEMAGSYYISAVDPETDRPYEYLRTSSTTYKICADFNKDSKDQINNSFAYPYGGVSWAHPAGHHCFEQVVNPNIYSKPTPLR